MNIDEMIASRLSLEKRGDVDEAKRILAEAVSLVYQQAMAAPSQEEKFRLIRRGDDIAEYIRVITSQPSAGSSFHVSASNTSIHSSEAPDITFHDLQGLEDVKKILRRHFVYPYKYPHIYHRFGIKYGGGVILYGPPGVGKTLLAKALASEIGATLFEANCSTWLGMYLGESEKNVAAFFQKAIQDVTRNPVLVFLDEFDAIAATRHGRDSEAMDRVVSQVLLEIAAAIKKGVMIIAATNRFEVLDWAFLRFGRFSKWIQIPLPDVGTRKLIAENDLSLAPCQEAGYADLVANLTENQNGADVRALVEEARLIAADRQVQLEIRGVIDPQVVTIEDIIQAADEHCHIA